MLFLNETAIVTSNNLVFAFKDIFIGSMVALDNGLVDTQWLCFYLQGQKVA
jgi:hypothetical protein